MIRFLKSHKSYGFNFQGHQLPPDAPCALCTHKTVHEGKCSTRFQVTCYRLSCSKTLSGNEKFHEHPSGTTSSRGISRRKMSNTISRRAQSRGKTPRRLHVERNQVEAITTQHRFASIRSPVSANTYQTLRMALEQDRSTS